VSHHFVIIAIAVLSAGGDEYFNKGPDTFSENVSGPFFGCQAI
jgi:hypothetical protein